MLGFCQSPGEAGVGGEAGWNQLAAGTHRSQNYLLLVISFRLALSLKMENTDTGLGDLWKVQSPLSAVCSRTSIFFSCPSK